MLNHLNKTEMADLFGIYFGQDYDLFTNYDESKSMIPRLVKSYKKDCSPQDIYNIINELKELIGLGYSEENLRDNFFTKLGISISTFYVGLTYQGFLEKEALLKGEHFLRRKGGGF